MGKTGKIYLAIIGFLLVFFVFLEYTKPKEISWFPSYDKSHKIPFGTKVIHDQMKVLFKNKFKDVKESPYTFLTDNNPKGCYLFVNQTISFGKEELDELLDWVSQGNQLFIASSSFEKKLLDTLGLKKDYLANYSTLKLSYELSLTNEVFAKNKKAVFDRNTAIYYFKNQDSLPGKATGLGKIGVKGYEAIYTNMVKHPFGNGQIVLSLFPEAFSNYFMLKSPNETYVSGVLSYLNTTHNIYFDNYYKLGSKYYSSPMYVFLNNASLKWAYYLMLIAILFYIIFEGKRKQRNIPIIAPLKNQTLDFVRTIANMYYEKSDHKDIAHYKINHFLAFVRKQQAIQVTEFDELQIKAIAERNNKPIETTKKLFRYIAQLQNKQTITKEELVDLNRMIEDFKK